jgi:prolyl oligopeptidase
VFEGKKEDVASAATVDFGADGKTERFIVRAVEFFTSELYHLGADGKPRLVPVPLSAEFQGLHKRQLLFKLRETWKLAGKTYAQGALISTSLDKFLESGEVKSVDVLFAPDARTAIDAVAPARDGVFVALLQNVKGRILQFTHDGKRWIKGEVALPDNGTVAIATASDFDGEAMLQYASFLTPDQLYLSTVGGGAPQPIKELPARFSAAGHTVAQHEATSKDGTKIPYFIVRKGGAPLDGQTPTLLYAYGGFEISTTPWYWSSAGKLWLERGGAYVIANIRGGGEFGPRWHEAALRENHQRNFDDLAAVARDLIARKLTSPRRLGAMGGSQGGLLVAATFVQNPDLFNAVACQVPLADMLRFTEMSAGASWVAEYGDPADPKMREIIAAWSPYQNLKAGVAYPRVFYMTSTKDDRVHPGHARKMAAKSQALGLPYYYYENIEGGHSAAANLKQRAEQLALTYVYLRRQLMD